MKNTVLIFLLLFAFNFDGNCQKISNYFICNNALGAVEFDKNISKKHLKKIGNYKKEIKPNKYDNRPYKYRFFHYNDTFYIAQDIEKRFSFKYYTSEVQFKYPAQIMTIKGIQIGQSTREDVIAAYGKPMFNAPYTVKYSFPNREYLTFVFYEKKETDEDYNPELKGKVVSIILQ